MVCLRDPAGYVEEPIVLSPVAYFIATMLDGVNDIVDIQYHFCNETGGRVLAAEDIQKVTGFLDSQGFLFSPRFHEIQRDVCDAFRKLPARPAHLAGISYPAEANSLRERLAEWFNPDVLRDDEATAPQDRIRGLIAPHIDFERGGAAYAHAYAGLAQNAVVDTALVFGVAHAGTQAPFVLTRKSFETPLGLVRADDERIDQLAAACSWDPFEEEIVHRTEHSIEFQAVMLAHVLGSGVRIVPVLCGTVGAEGSPDVADFLEACRGMAGESDGATVVVAGADLAHVGLRFGDAFDVDEEVLGHIRSRDAQDLAFVEHIDPDGWRTSVMQDGNERRVCGLGCIYAALKSVQGVARRGKVRHYGIAPDPAGGVVSYAAATLY